MESATIFGGFGGQGLLFAGQVLAQAAVLEDLAATWLPSYGPEMRGGTASCTVVLADHAIGSPVVDTADGVVALNPPSLAKFEPFLVPGGVVVVNASLVEAEPRRRDVTIVPIPCSAIARASGDDRLVSIVGLGALIAARPTVARASVERALVDVVGSRAAGLVEANLEAFARGYEAALAALADGSGADPARPTCGATGPG